MRDEDFSVIYQSACQACDRVTGRETQRAINYLLQMIDALREETGFANRELQEMRERTHQDG